jgi:hypothetical protein
MRVPMGRLLPFAAVLAACAPNGMSAGGARADDVRVVQATDALPPSCESRGTVPRERQETLRRRIMAVGANVIRYPLEGAQVSVFRCDGADVEKFERWSVGA